jgi:hypothetical protein
MTIQEEMAADIDWRNGELAELRVILHKAKLTESQRKTYIRYIVPAIYALWEGFVKKSFELYGKKISSTGTPLVGLNENLLTHAIMGHDKLSLNKERTNYQTQKEFALLISEYINQPLSTQCKIPTKSNVNSEVLADLYCKFNLGNIDPKVAKSLDKLLFFRNAIAHGDNSIPVEDENIDEFSKLFQDLMLDVFNRVDDAVKNKTYLK